MKYSSLVLLSIISINLLAQKLDTVTIKKELYAGWNIIAYPYSEPLIADSVLMDIWDNVEAIKDFDRFYIEEYESTSSLDTLYPGDGYMVKVSEDCILTWNILSWDYSECKEIGLPSVFSPDVEPINLFQVKDHDCTEYKTFNLKVYDRTGRIVFETDDPTIGWDGTYDGYDLPAGFYVWLLKAEFSDGTFLNDTTENSGDVVIVR